MLLKTIFRKAGICFLLFLSLTFLKWGMMIRPESALFISGGLLGIFLLDMDYLIFAFYTRPEDPLSIAARKCLAEKNYRELRRILGEIRENREELVLHGAFFGLILIVVVLFAVTSSGSVLGAGLALAILLGYLLDAAGLRQKNPLRLNKILFWQIRRAVTPLEQNYFLLAVAGGFLFGLLLFVL